MITKVDGKSRNARDKYKAQLQNICLAPGNVNISWFYIFRYLFSLTCILKLCPIVFSVIEGLCTECNFVTSVALDLE